MPTSRPRLQWASRSSQAGTTGPLEEIVGSRGWNAARAVPVISWRKPATGTATIMPTTPAATAPIGSARSAIAGWTRRAAEPSRRERPNVSATSMATAAASISSAGTTPWPPRATRMMADVATRGPR